MSPLYVDGNSFISVEVRLPKTNLLMISCEDGYVMCGALDVALLRDKLAHRGIMAARAVGVKTMDELLMGTVESATQSAEVLGIVPGTSIRNALLKMKLKK